MSRRCGRRREKVGKALISNLGSLSVRIGGLVVEYSPATRVTRVRFPANADKFLNGIWIGAELDKNGTKLQYGCRGRVVKAMDSKSIGIFPRRFESCRQRAVLKDYFEGYP